MHFQQRFISRFSFILLLIILASQAMSQRVFVNHPGGFYELSGGAGSCGSVPLTNECAPTLGNGTFSMAVYKDTIYYINSGGSLNSFKIGVPGSCRTYANVGNFSAMTVDQNGILYFASNILWSYDPYNNQLTNLGTMPFSSAGDLIFYNGKLLMAGIPAGIYEVNIANPPASSLYMSTNGLQFYGLISYPVPCGNSRFFGIVPAGGGTLYELDMVNRTVVGVACSLGGINVYDGGSTTEGGLNAGITVTSLQVNQPCLPAITGSVQIQGVADNFTIQYTLDHTVSNTTGFFDNLTIGQHTITLTTTSCTVDTVINIAIGLNPLVDVQKVDATNCEGNNGSVTLTGASGHLPITYTLLNTGAQQTNGTFSSLQPGTYQFRISDAAGCSKDTFAVVLQQPPVFVQGVRLDDAHCGFATGFVKLNVAGGDTAGVTSSLANGPFLPQAGFYNLSPGTYRLQARRGTLCFYDTTIVIADVVDPKPTLTAVITDQVCYANNGNVALTATAAGYTFQYQLDGGSYSNVNSFGNLAPGSYTIGIRNQYGCVWDTPVVVRAYPKIPVFATVTSTDPECDRPTNGDIRVTVTGTEGPYTLLLNNRTYANSELIAGLTEGTYTIYIHNKDGCTIDSVVESLTIILEPHCIVVSVPSAFTPNGDGRNDIFRPLQTYFTRNMRLQIYNRYGQLLYNGTGPGVQWNGTYKGVLQNSGSYVYWLTYTDYMGVPQQVKGSFLLIR